MRAKSARQIVACKRSLRRGEDAGALWIRRGHVGRKVRVRSGQDTCTRTAKLLLLLLLLFKVIYTR